MFQLTVLLGLIGQNHGMHHFATANRGIKATHDQLLELLRGLLKFRGERGLPKREPEFKDSKYVAAQQTIHYDAMHK